MVCNFLYIYACLSKASIPTSSISMINAHAMHPNTEVMFIVKFQYAMATSAMLALPYDHFLVLLLFLDVPITAIMPSPFLTSFLNVLFNLYMVVLAKWL